MSSDRVLSNKYNIKQRQQYYPPNFKVMNYWINFPTYVIVAVVCWLVCLIVQLSKKTNDAVLLFFALSGSLSLIIFALGLWQHLGRPPIRTLGETRLWYSVFLPFIGMVTFWKWRYRWLLNYSLLMAGVFLIISILHPDTYSKTLMPALQSIWFIPHVLVYIFSYAVLAASSIIAAYALYQYYRGLYNTSLLDLADNLVYIGFGFLSLGLLFGALWAKEAWGHYWTWDPKETWAMLTWLAYLIYIHVRYRHPDAVKVPLISLTLAFVVLLLCWFGVNYMPSASQSVHTYTS